MRQQQDFKHIILLGRDYGKGNDYSGEIAFEIDKEIRMIINQCYDNCKKLISENMDLLKLIAETLIEEETITNEQIMNLVDHGTIAPLNEEKAVAAKDSAEGDDAAETTDSKADEAAPAEKPKRTRAKKVTEKPSFEEAMEEVVGEKPAPKKRTARKKADTEAKTEKIVKAELKSEQKDREDSKES